MDDVRTVHEFETLEDLIDKILVMGLIEFLLTSKQAGHIRIHELKNCIDVCKLRT